MNSQKHAFGSYLRQINKIRPRPHAPLEHEPLTWRKALIVFVEIVVCIACMIPLALGIALLAI